MCNLKQTPHSNWWSNDSTSFCDTTGLGMVLQPQQPLQCGVETPRLLPSTGMLQYLPFSLHDKLPVALEGTQLKPLLHQRGWQAASKPLPPLPGCPTWSHPGRGQMVLASVAGLGAHCWQYGGKAAETLHLHLLSANRMGTGRQESPSCAPSEGVVASILCRDTISPSWTQTDGKEHSKG